MTIDHHAIVPPPDAVQVDPWHPSGTGRGFTGTTRQLDRADLDGEPAEPAEVVVSGVQFARDGSVERWLFVRNANGPMTPSEARQLARLLMGAANEIQDRSV